MEFKQRTKPSGSYSRGYLKKVIKKHASLQKHHPRGEAKVQPVACCSHQPSQQEANFHIPQSNPVPSDSSSSTMHYLNFDQLFTSTSEKLELVNNTNHFSTTTEPSCLTEWNSKYDSAKQSQEFRAHLCDWCVRNHVTHSAINGLLSILREDLQLTFLPKDCRTLLKIEQKGDIISMGSEGSYYNFGVESQISTVLSRHTLKHSLQSLFASKGDNEIRISLNVDGLPLTKSSTSCFWPILATIDNIKNCSPFPVGVFHGNSKPIDINIFLKPVIDELKILEDKGILFNNQKFFVRVFMISCDAPAKAFVLNVKNHNGYYSCTKCHVSGEFVERRMTFSNITSLPRTNDEFQAGTDEDYHSDKTLTPLTALKIDLVKDIPLDYLHLVCLGIMKKLLIFWIRGKQGVRLFKEDIAQIEIKLEKTRKVCVKEFSRLPRSFKELDRWKGTEFRQFLLYYGPYVLKPFLKEPMWSHFLSLHIAMRIFISDLCLEEKYLNFAEKLLRYFVEKFEYIYGLEHVGHNVHNLIHLSDDVRHYGPLDNFSCFKFENCMYEIKKSLKTARNPLKQYVNRYYEYMTYCLEDSKECSQISMLNENTCSFNQKNFIITNTEPNCFCILKNGEVVKVERFFEERGTICFQYSSFGCVRNCFNSPCKSLEIGCGLLGEKMKEKKIHSVDMIAAKVVKIDNMFITLLHTFQ